MPVLADDLSYGLGEQREPKGASDCPVDVHGAFKGRCGLQCCIPASAVTVRLLRLDTHTAALDADEVLHRGRSISNRELRMCGE
jgi:hypothetical protein